MSKFLICLCLFLLTQHLYLQSDASALSLIRTHVPTSWKKIFSYNNSYSYPVTQTAAYTKGLKTRANGRSLLVTQELGSRIEVGQYIEIQRLEFCYMDDSDNDHSDHYAPTTHRRESMEKDEIYQQIARQSRVVIPARTLLTKWQLVANVAGHEVGYDHTMETHGDTMPHIHYNAISYGVPVDDFGDDDHCHDYEGDRDHDPDHDHDHDDHQPPPHRILPVEQEYHGHHHNDFSRATLAYIWRTPIHYGSTKIRIRHMATHQYLMVARPQSRMSPATIGSSFDMHLVLYNTRSGIKVRTMNPVYRGYEWLTSSASGQVHFTRSSRSMAQHWVMDKTTYMRDGDVVTFKNKMNGRGFLRYYNGQVTTQVYGANGNDNEWMLEAF